MPQVRYLPEFDELEIVYKESSVVSTYKTVNGLIVEFDGDDLAYIIAPHFSQAIHMRPGAETVFKYREEYFSDSILTVTIDMDGKNINIKIDFS